MTLKVHYSYPSINGLFASIACARCTIVNGVGFRLPTTTPTVTPTTRAMTNIVTKLPIRIKCFLVSAIVLFSTMDCVVVIITTINITCPLYLFLYRVIMKEEKENVSTIEKKAKNNSIEEKEHR